jgi:hypothetical protein
MCEVNKLNRRRKVFLNFPLEDCTSSGSQKEEENPIMTTTREAIFVCWIVAAVARSKERKK